MGSNSAASWVGSAAEWRARVGDRVADHCYRWCNSDLNNSSYQYCVGLNVHPGGLDQGGTAKRWFWFMASACVPGLVESGGRLMRVTVPDDAIVYQDGAHPDWFRASKFVLSDVDCAACEVLYLKDEGLLSPVFDDLLSHVEADSLPPITHYEACPAAR